MKDYPFTVAAGTIPGRDHVGRNGLLLGRNNQDAYAWCHEDNFLVAVVCDGCGSEQHSEIGAKLGARLTIAAAERRLLQRGGIIAAHESQAFWEGVRRDVLAETRVLALQLAGHRSFTQTVSDYFLWSTLALLITPHFTEVVGIGDGVFAINGEISMLEPEAGNKPLYLAYDLIDSEFSDTPELLRFALHRRIATRDLASALIGTDGVVHFMESAPRNIPGTEDELGPLSQFWTEDRYFKNPDAVRRRLALANSEVTHLDRKRHNVLIDNGLLPDDTTLMVVRRS